MLSINRFFPILAIAVSVLAWYEPQPLIAWKSATVPLLMVIMFCMGLTLRPADFQRVLNKPKPIATGVMLQFLLMPLTAWALARVLGLSDELTIGLILVGACAGGTASNVMTYLAGGDVALSVSMTLMSTLWSVVLTPYLVWFYSGAEINVDIQAMIFSIAKIVITPILLGLLANHYIPELGKRLNQYLPDLASAVILIVVAIIVALNADEIATLGMTAALAVMLHNLIGLAGGYWIARWNGHTEVEARTIAIEVGMQNSGLGVALALKFYGPVAALPGALFSIWHNISGSVLAAFWKWKIQQNIKQIHKQKSAAVTTYTPD
ncbi:bile acid:sodium symporter family protein [Bacterioplanoides sp. SCSIO 12839]|uniref:bile acid:sodium symporter family protein n=1 Tax=Bacterioplanoides sp. SCSIO 12839 TaxID=2829569 RepID=UPI002105E5B4|nr:bile acid:sodium symporter family protein [Bacterioplanoides sp. SCSIO 12839]UTW49268.1 bile acid:sodium symporter family protein [Bacterioplanoides sp. SCSIO 12839]